MPVACPKKSGVHRAACVALYRALLQQCNRLANVVSQVGDLEGEPRGRKRQPYYNGQCPDQVLDTFLARRVIRRRFKGDAHIQSPISAAEMLKVGYESLKVLESLGSHTHYSLTFEVNHVLASIDAAEGLDMVHPTATDSKKRRTQVQGVPSSSNAKAKPTKPMPKKVSVLDRPLERHRFSGPRHVPRLVSASGVPFLRIKKPQPAALSLIIRNKIAQRQRRFDQLALLDESFMPLAHFEDIWEEHLLNLFKSYNLVSNKATNGSSNVQCYCRQSKAYFKDSVGTAKSQLYSDLSKESSRANQLAVRLWHIAEKERKLKFEEEGILVPVLGRRTPRRYLDPGGKAVTFDTGS